MIGGMLCFVKKVLRCRGAFLCKRNYFTAALPMSFVRRDFKRLALFLLMARVFAALSRAWYARASACFASPTLPSDANFRTAFTASLYAPLRTTFRARRRTDWRSAFFAEVVIGMETIVGGNPYSVKCGYDYALCLCDPRAPWYYKTQ